MNAHDLFGDAIFSYSRAQAIEDGELVELSSGILASLVREAGFWLHVACTARVFAECIELTPAAERAAQDVRGRAWDILFVLSRRIRQREPRGQSDRLAFQVLVVRDRVKPTPTELVAVCGPGDDGEPVLTIMFPEEG